MPKKVDEYYKQVKEKNPDYSEEQAWATAWSIYCKHKNPGSPSCKKDQSEYLKGKKAMSTDTELRGRLIRLAHENPELRPQILPLLKKEAAVVNVGDRFKDKWGVIWVVSEPDRGGTVHAYAENGRGKMFAQPFDVADLLKRYTRLASKQASGDYYVYFEDEGGAMVRFMGPMSKSRAFNMARGRTPDASALLDQGGEISALPGSHLKRDVGHGSAAWFAKLPRADKALLDRSLAGSRMASRSPEFIKAFGKALGWTPYIDANREWSFKGGNPTTRRGIEAALKKAGGRIRKVDDYAARMKNKASELTIDVATPEGDGMTLWGTYNGKNVQGGDGLHHSDKTWLY